MRDSLFWDRIPGDTFRKYPLWFLGFSDFHTQEISFKWRRPRRNSRWFRISSFCRSRWILIVMVFSSRSTASRAIALIASCPNLPSRLSATQSLMVIPKWSCASSNAVISCGANGETPLFCLPPKRLIRAEKKFPQPLRLRVQTLPFRSSLGVCFLIIFLQHRPSNAQIKISHCIRSYLWTKFLNLSPNRSMFFSGTPQDITKKSQLHL